MFHKAPSPIAKLHVFNSSSSPTKHQAINIKNQFSPSQKLPQIHIERPYLVIEAPDLLGTQHPPHTLVHQVLKPSISSKSQNQTLSKILPTLQYDTPIISKTFQFTLQKSHQQVEKVPTSTFANRPNFSEIEHFFVQKLGPISAAAASGITNRRITDYISGCSDQNFCIQTKNLPGNETLKALQLKNAKAWGVSQVIFGCFQAPINKISLQRLINFNGILIESLVVSDGIQVGQDGVFDPFVDDQVVRTVGKLINLSIFDQIFSKIIAINFRTDGQKFEQLVKSYALYTTFSNEIRSKNALNLIKIVQKLPIYFTESKLQSPLIMIYLSLIVRLNYNCTSIILTNIIHFIDKQLKILENPLTSTKIRQGFAQTTLDISDDVIDDIDCYYVEKDEKGIIMQQILKNDPNITNFDASTQLILQRQVKRLQGRQGKELDKLFTVTDVLISSIFCLTQCVYCQKQIDKVDSEVVSEILVLIGRIKAMNKGCLYKSSSHEGYILEKLCQGNKAEFQFEELVFDIKYLESCVWQLDFMTQ